MTLEFRRWACFFLSERSSAGKVENCDHWDEKSVNGEKSLLPQSLQKIVKAKLLLTQWITITLIVSYHQWRKRENHPTCLPFQGLDLPLKKTIVLITEQIKKEKKTTKKATLLENSRFSTSFSLAVGDCYPLHVHKSVLWMSDIFWDRLFIATKSPPCFVILKYL